MNKLTRALIYEIAIQGRSKSHWDKVYGIYPKIPETRTSWKEWIEYELDMYGAIQPNTWCSVGARNNEDTSWKIEVFRNNFIVIGDSVYAHLKNPTETAKSAFYQYLMGFFMNEGPRGNPEEISPTHWLKDMVQLSNRLANHPYMFYISKDGLPLDYMDQMVWIRKPEDLDEYLAKVEPETLKLVVWTLESSCLDFYPLPVLQVLKRAQQLGINYSL